jgi:hypothetical protein
MRTQRTRLYVQRVAFTLLTAIGVIVLINRAMASPLVVSALTTPTPIHFTFTPQLVARSLSQHWQPGEEQTIHWSPTVDPATHAAQPIPIELTAEVHGPFPTFGDAQDQALRNSCLSASLSPTNRIAAAALPVDTTSITQRSFDMVVPLPNDIVPGFYYWLACAIQQPPGDVPRLVGGYSSAFEITPHSIASIGSLTSPVFTAQAAGA